MKRAFRILAILLAVGVITAAGVSFYPVMRDFLHPFSPESAPFRVVAIPPGSFLMGSEKGDPDEKPVHRVIISRGFFMSATEITQGQYRAVMNGNPSVFKGTDRPVESVGWEDAAEFCRKLTESERKKGSLPGNMEYRLPTEAEWEYCCRAGSETAFCMGDDEKALGEYSWFAGNSSKETHPVGTKKPNAWGLYDMHGNVWELCMDWYVNFPTDPSEQTDPIGAPMGTSRASRGGCWGEEPYFCRSSIRWGYSPACENVGFRVVVAPGDIALEAREAEEERQKDEEKRKKEDRKVVLAGLRKGLVAIPPGTFLMGSEKGYNEEKPAHRVTITRAFFMGATEVTLAQYMAVMGYGKGHYPDDNLPATIRFDEILEFCSKLTNIERADGNMPDGMEYRLPTEAEWEYCCRAGTTTEWFFGDDEKLLGDYAWYIGNSDDKRHPVGGKKPNAWGLYDMYGNVSEWCLDWYSDGYLPEAQTDPLGSPIGDIHVLRGGSYHQMGRPFCRSSTRFRNDSWQFGPQYGFRIVLAPRLVRP
ncbi:MAG: formylglycine-generating enzyme family protein [Candidatus Brocadiia bacterium]